MKNKIFKVFLMIFIIFMILGGVFFYKLINYFSGDDDFYNILGNWKDKENKFNVTIRKGDRAVGGYSYGYLCIMSDKNNIEIPIKYKERKIINVEEVDKVDLKIIDDKKIMGSLLIEGTNYNVTLIKNE